MDISLNIVIGLTRELHSLLDKAMCVMSSVGKAPEPKVITEAPKVVEAPEPPVVVVEEPEVTPQEPEAPTAPAVENEEFTQALDEAEKEAPKVYTEADIRAAIHETRLRIQGEDYQENPTGERTKRWRVELNGEFKRIARLYGAEKPSELSPEGRAEFIRECNLLDVVDGKIQPKLPF